MTKEKLQLTIAYLTVLALIFSATIAINLEAVTDYVQYWKEK